MCHGRGSGIAENTVRRIFRQQAHLNQHVLQSLDVLLGGIPADHNFGSIAGFRRLRFHIRQGKRRFAPLNVGLSAAGRHCAHPHAVNFSGNHSGGAGCDHLVVCRAGAGGQASVRVIRLKVVTFHVAFRVPGHRHVVAAHRKDIPRKGNAVDGDFRRGHRANLGFRRRRGRGIGLRGGNRAQNEGHVAPGSVVPGAAGGNCAHENGKRPVLGKDGCVHLDGRFGAFAPFPLFALGIGHIHIIRCQITRGRPAEGHAVSRHVCHVVFVHLRIVNGNLRRGHRADFRRGRGRGFSQPCFLIRRLFQIPQRAGVAFPAYRQTRVVTGVCPCLEFLHGVDRGVAVYAVVRTLRQQHDLDQHALHRLNGRLVGILVDDRAAFIGRWRRTGRRSCRRFQHELRGLGHHIRFLAVHGHGAYADGIHGVGFNLLRLKGTGGVGDIFSLGNDGSVRIRHIDVISLHAARSGPGQNDLFAADLQHAAGVFLAVGENLQRFDLANLACAGRRSGRGVGLEALLHRIFHVLQRRIIAISVRAQRAAAHLGIHPFLEGLYCLRRIFSIYAVGAAGFQISQLNQQFLNVFDLGLVQVCAVILDFRLGCLEFLHLSGNRGIVHPRKLQLRSRRNGGRNIGRGRRRHVRLPHLVRIGRGIHVVIRVVQHIVQNGNQHKRRHQHHHHGRADDDGNLLGASAAVFLFFGFRGRVFPLHDVSGAVFFKEEMALCRVFHAFHAGAQLGQSLFKGAFLSRHGHNAAVVQSAGAVSGQIFMNAQPVFPLGVERGVYDAAGRLPKGAAHQKPFIVQSGTGHQLNLGHRGPGIMAAMGTNAFPAGVLETIHAQIFVCHEILSLHGL